MKVGDFYREVEEGSIYLLARVDQRMDKYDIEPRNYVSLIGMDGFEWSYPIHVKSVYDISPSEWEVICDGQEDMFVQTSLEIKEVR